jgi:amino acid transporter
MSPFLIIFVWGVATKQFHPKYLMELPPSLEKVQWPLFFSTIVWGYGGYDDVGNIVEEMENPRKQFPKALGLLIILSIISYLAAFAGAVSAQSNYSHWKEGYFSEVAFNVRKQPHKKATPL